MLNFVINNSTSTEKFDSTSLKADDKTNFKIYSNKL